MAVGARHCLYTRSPKRAGQKLCPAGRAVRRGRPTSSNRHQHGITRSGRSKRSGSSSERLTDSADVRQTLIRPPISGCLEIYRERRSGVRSLRHSWRRHHHRSRRPQSDAHGAPRSAPACGGHCHRDDYDSSGHEPVGRMFVLHASCGVSRFHRAKCRRSSTKFRPSRRWLR